MAPLLRDEDIRIDIGRGGNGGDFTRMVHLPTGIKRYHPGPLRNVDCPVLYRKWRAEIEQELQSRQQDAGDAHSTLTDDARKDAE